MTDILFFVEDDGAANLIRGLAPMWQARHLNVKILATGPAARKLAHLKEEHTVVAADTSADVLLAQYQPRLLAVGTSENIDTLALPLTTIARERGALTVGLIDAYANAAWRWRGRTENSLAYLPDWLLVSDEEVSAVYQALGVPGERIHVIGYVQVDYLAGVRADLEQEGRARVRARFLPAEANTQDVLVFVAEQFESLNPVHHYRERGQRTLEDVLSAVATLTPRPYIVVRLHPKNKPTDFAAYRQCVNCVSAGGDGLPVVYSGDMVIGNTSTLLFEAALLGRPTVSVLYRREEKQWLPSIAAGVTPVVSTAAAIAQEWQRITSGRWRPPTWPAAWRPGARERLASFLQQLL